MKQAANFWLPVFFISPSSPKSSKKTYFYPLFSAKRPDEIRVIGKTPQLDSLSIFWQITDTSNGGKSHGVNFNFWVNQ